MPTAQPNKRYVFRMYTANRKGEMAVVAERLKATIEAMTEDGSIVVEVVDVLSEPERAVADQVIATPTLIKEYPEPVGRVLGDLSDPERVLLMLGVMAVEPVREK